MLDNGFMISFPAVPIVFLNKERFSLAIHKARGYVLPLITTATMYS